MPSVSKAQQGAAGIARAVEKGDKPKSELRGASKRMFKSMHGKGELHKFAATKRKGLPQKVGEAKTARAMLEESHGVGSWGGRGDWHGHEGRDDAPKLGLGKTGLKFARMGSKEAFKTGGTGTDAKWKTSIKLRAKLAHEKPGGKMKSMDKVGRVPSAIKDSVTPKQVVAAMLDD
jgi:hypothetical protein